MKREERMSKKEPVFGKDFCKYCTSMIQEKEKQRIAVAWFKREFHWIVKKVLKDIDDFEKSFNRPIEYYKINDHPTYLKLMRGKRFREMFGK